MTNPSDHNNVSKIPVHSCGLIEEQAHVSPGLRLTRLIFKRSLHFKVGHPLDFIRPPNLIPAWIHQFRENFYEENRQPLASDVSGVASTLNHLRPDIQKVCFLALWLAGGTIELLGLDFWETKKESLGNLGCFWIKDYPGNREW